jgi:hypothetical protein
MNLPQAWTKQELEWLRLHYPSATLKQSLAALPNRTQQQIYTKTSKMGIRKTTPIRVTPQAQGVQIQTHTRALPVVFDLVDDPRNIKEQPLYDGAELLPSERPGANDFAQWPSVMGGWRIWRDGRRERMEQ